MRAKKAKALRKLAVVTYLGTDKKTPINNIYKDLKTTYKQTKGKQ